MTRSTVARAAAVAGLLAMTTACLSSGGGGGGGAGQDQSGGEGKKAIAILGNFTGEEEAAFNAALKEFPDKSITITYTGSQDFTTLIRSRVAANNNPDIGLFPQPGVLADIAKRGALRDVSEVVDLDAVKEKLIPGFLDAAEVDGKTYAAPMRMAVKSIIWTPKGQFEQVAGGQPPATLDELFALTDRIKTTGTAPWCIGMESGAATGWVATDWMEDLVLRTAGPDVYDQWVKHEIPFNDERIKEAGRAFERIFAPEGNVFGGRKAIASTNFRTAGNPMFQNPPKCYMHKQGNFIQSPGFFPNEVQQNIDENVNVLPFPGTQPGAAPQLLGGDLAAAFNNDPSTKKVMEFLASENFGGPWAQAGGWISPYKGFDESKYPNETTRAIARNALAAEIGRYDGSDVMPAAVGAGSFWKGMVAWVSGQRTLDQVLDQIEASWPTS